MLPDGPILHLFYRIAVVEQCCQMVQYYTSVTYFLQKWWNFTCFYAGKNSCRTIETWCNNTILNSEILLKLIGKIKYLTDDFQFCFVLALVTLNAVDIFYFCIYGNTIGILADNLLHMLCLVFAFRYLKLHDDIVVDATATELKLLKNISSPFVPDTFETVRDVSKALTPALRAIYRVTQKDAYPYFVR